MRKTNVAFILYFCSEQLSHLCVSTNQDQVIISLKDSLHISQSCFSSFAQYMIKRGVLGALLIFDKIFFLSTHIARIWM